MEIPFFKISATNGFAILKSETVNGWGSINKSSSLRKHISSICMSTISSTDSNTIAISISLSGLLVPLAKETKRIAFSI